MNEWMDGWINIIRKNEKVQLLPLGNLKGLTCDTLVN